MIAAHSHPPCGQRHSDSTKQRRVNLLLIYDNQTITIHYTFNPRSKISSALAPRTVQCTAIFSFRRMPNERTVKRAKINQHTSKMSELQLFVWWQKRNMVCNKPPPVEPKINKQCSVAIMKKTVQELLHKRHVQQFCVQHQF